MEPQLKRVIGVWGAIWMGLGSILGTGVFVSLGLATLLVDEGILLALILAALVALANGLSSAQLAAAHPVSGGTYEHAHRLLHPVAGFIAGWLFLIAKSASAATAALGMVAYLLHILGVELPQGLRALLTLALVMGMTWLVAGGLKRSSLANQVIVSLTLCALGAFILFGALTTPLSWALWPSAASRAWSSSQVFLHATALMFVAYTGYGRIATLGEEVRQPARTIPVAIMLTLFVSMVIYVLVAWTALSAVGASMFGALSEGEAAPLEQLARSFSMPQIAYVVSLGAVTAMAGVLLNLLLGLSRVLLAMARRQEMPARFALIDPHTNSPKWATWAIGAVISAMVLSGDVRATWSFSAFNVLIYYGITNAAALSLPAKQRRYPRAISMFGLISCLGLAFFVELRIWVSGLALLSAGLVWRHFKLRGQLSA